VIQLDAGKTSAVVSDATIGTATASDNSGSVTVTHTGVPAGNIFSIGKTTITWVAVDAAGNRTTVTQTVTVIGSYSPPAVTPAPNQSTTEGASTSFNLGSFSGGSGSWTVNVNWGDGTTSTLATQPGSMTAPHIYANDRSTPYTVTVTVVDGTGQSASSSFTVTVANAPPTVRINTPGPGSNLKWKTSYPFTATFSDQGTADTHTCTISWGDGTSSTGTVSEKSGSGTCTGQHTWMSQGSFTITVTVRDSSGATATATSAITVTKNGGTVYKLFSYVGPKPTQRTMWRLG
jgi:hypothetical protein